MSLLTFRGGVHPYKELDEKKGLTGNQPSKPFSPSVVYIPLDTHIGPPSKPVVKKDDQVKLGQVIAEPGGDWGIYVHASVSGTVKEVGAMQMFGKMPSPFIAIENDKQDSWVELNPCANPKALPAEELCSIVRNAGICGMGGAAFPTHVKLSIPQGKSADTIIVNGCECETFLTSDERLMMERPESIFKGLKIVLKSLNVERGIIAVEDNKPLAIAALKALVPEYEGIEVATVQAKYPQGGEKQLIEAVLKREVPRGGLPIDVNTIVLNVATVSAIADAVYEGKPLVKRLCSATGQVKEPANLLLPNGTLTKDAVEFCGGYATEPGKIFVGGSMMGVCIPNDEVPLSKQNNGFVVLSQKEAKLAEETNCIRCARCVDVCPTRLNPVELRGLLIQDRLDDAEKSGLEDCILCGACSFVCPAKRRLTATFKLGKDTLAVRRKKA